MVRRLSAAHHGAAIRVTQANQGKPWAQIMDLEGIDFATIER